MICTHFNVKKENGKACKTKQDCLWALANPTTFATNLASTAPTVNYLRFANNVVDPNVKQSIMKIYGKGQIKEEQTEKETVDQDLFKMMLKY
jgi:hypothetical protein